MDGNAVANLHLALTDGVLSSIVEKKTAKETWDTLTRLYEAKSLHNKIFLKRRLYTLRMVESLSMTDHINIINTLFSQLTELGDKIEENERAELLLQCLPDSYNQLIINLTNNILVEYLVFDDVVTAILEEESRRKNKEDRSKSSQQAETLTMMRGRSTERGPSGSHNHDQLQKEEDNVTLKENSETTNVQVENNPEEEDSVSSEAEPDHEIQVTEESKALEVQRSTRDRRPPVWHLEYVTESNVTYCLLTEDGEPLTFHEARNSSDASLWMIEMREEIEALPMTIDKDSDPVTAKIIRNK
ncbi:hypothetical protein LWI29_029253 [Acer saccharum]|uniref:Retrovirus-related Pol polyprotein from transposon TNT 1-94 n=1 Tax=Acer saccharum TaxID=4024 RepID=A0AA39TVW0_ACESA|nr:hypothetical protein LWI29_029253 [Acer saccharum]